MKVSVSFINSNYEKKETIKRIDKTDCDYLHIDIMDGKFVENKNFTYSEIEKLVGGINKPLDIHFMCMNPTKDLLKYAMLNCSFIIFHYEAIKNHMEVIESIKALGIDVGISIKLETKIDKIENLLPYVDQVLLMSVEPGAGGQSFDEKVIPKVEELYQIREEKKYNFIISVDGGINADTVKLIPDADMVVSGSYICKSDNYQKQINMLRN